MKFDSYFACDQLNSTNHSALLEVSSSAPCQHILTECIGSCTFMDTLPLMLMESCFYIVTVNESRLNGDVLLNSLFQSVTHYHIVHR